jgi:hypothetical protein
MNFALPSNWINSNKQIWHKVQIITYFGCYWWKTVWRTRELHYYMQTEKNLAIESSQVVSSPVLCTVCVVLLFHIELHWIHQNTWKPIIVCCLFSGCGINAFRMASSNSSLAAKSCACAYIAFLAGIFSWYADSISSAFCLRIKLENYVTH